MSYVNSESPLLLLADLYLNYLCEREQSVVLDGVKSSLKPVLSGVPQGSILGPILFVLFIYDLHEGISTDTHIALYADDTKLWRSIKNEEDITQLQRDINILYFWSLNNKMKFHPDKCKVVTIEHRPSLCCLSLSPWRKLTFLCR